LPTAASSFADVLEAVLPRVGDGGALAAWVGRTEAGRAALRGVLAPGRRARLQLRLGSLRAAHPRDSALQLRVRLAVEAARELEADRAGATATGDARLLDGEAAHRRALWECLAGDNNGVRQRTTDVARGGGPARRRCSTRGTGPFQGAYSL
jgi:hypothetical protein